MKHIALAVLLCTGCSEFDPTPCQLLQESISAHRGEPDGIDYPTDYDVGEVYAERWWYDGYVVDFIDQDDGSCNVNDYRF